ncbi:MAG: ABC transporter permease subunit [Bacteroidota bacterium]
MARHRSWSNSAASLMISVGGAGVIAIVVAIFVFIGYETLPLWLPASTTNLGITAPADSATGILIVGENEYRTVAYAILQTGDILFFDPRSGAVLHREPIASDWGGAKYAVSDPSQKYFLIINFRGQAIIKSIAISYTETDYQFSSAYASEISRFDIASANIKSLDFDSRGEDEFYAVIVSDSSRATAYRIARPRSLFGGSTPELSSAKLESNGDEMITIGAIDRFGDKAILATSSGKASYWDLRQWDAPQFVQFYKLSSSAITSMKFLLGGQAVIVGDESGEVSTWTWVLDSTSSAGIGMFPLNSFEPHNGPVTTISSANRNKSFLTGSRSGEVALHYQTTGKTLFKRQESPVPVKQVSFSPRSDGFLVLAADGTVLSDSLSSPHPEISPGVLFGKVQYEGYKVPTYTWQSTGGTDDFEAKFSLTPLLFGTVKGAVYALVFALPMAILGALYTALFAHPRIRNLIKPLVEIMAALPSVVIGFMAALWLAPLLEKRFVDVMLVIATFPLAVIAAFFAWRILPKSFTNRLLFGSEIFLLVPILAGVMYLSSLLAPTIESALFDGSFRQWLFESAHITFDQRNSLVVGFAMGFAVIPIIFTISEDALSAVPEHLTAGSLALGATRWQTATRVVLPTASPGIFSAAMIGFGRAVGETMIVLMATGNTPLMDFSPFVGMRTLSANIAVEIPEAPHLGTLYRILFLSGLLLFAFTFVVNTVAEIIRQRLRKRYSTI